MAQSESARVAEMQRLSDERRASIIEAVALVWQHGPEASAKAALDAVVVALRAEADYLTANKVKGHVTQSQTIKSGAGRVAAYAMKMSDASTVAGHPLTPEQVTEHTTAKWAGVGAEVHGGTGRLQGPTYGVPPNLDPTASSPQPALFADPVQQPCAHPNEAWSTRKDGSIVCTACQTPLTTAAGTASAVAELNPWANSIDADPFAIHTAGPDDGPAPHVVFQQPGAPGDALSYLSGQTDSYEPQGATTVTPAPASTPDPFSNPTAAPNNRADKRPPMQYMDVRGLFLQLEATGSQSVSSIEARQSCGMKLGFDRLARRGLIGPPVPQWSLIGGKAFHTLIELMERWVWSTNRNAPGSASLAVFTPALVPQHWTQQLDRMRDEALAGTPYTIDDIRASNKGLEGYDWWRIEGADMVNRYVAVHTGQDYTSKFRLASFDNGQTPALEVEYRLNTNPLAGGLTTSGAPLGSGIELHGFIDRIDVAVDGSCYVIRDFKSGRSKGSMFQGATYIHAARRTLPIPAETPILFSNYDARTGGYLDPRQLDLTITWDEVVARAEEAETANAARIYPASPSPFCGGCGHAAICPGRVA